ncbi:MAG TPA: pyruvate kinase [Cyclobacteriaceae bacterium]
MKIQKQKAEELIKQIDGIIDAIKKANYTQNKALKKVCSVYTKSAENLINYKALRRFDLRVLQKDLEDMGMSRLELSEGHVMASLISTKQILQGLIGAEITMEKAGLSIKNANKLLDEHTEVILGEKDKDRRVRIMVTQPSEAANDYQIVYEMVKSGMNCARVNCAHDGPEVWEKIINNIKKASAELSRDVKIAMDLAGPKIRTGAIKPGEKIRKFSPERDEMGFVINPAGIILMGESSEELTTNSIPVDEKWLSALECGDIITLKDTRQKDRILKVIEVNEEQVVVNCYDSSYIGTGTILCPVRKNLSEITVGELPPIEQSIVLRTNDHLTVHKDSIIGEPAQFDNDGNLLRQAHIGCQLEEVFDRVKVGEKILFDDGKIEGIIEETNPDSFKVHITRAKESGDKLKAEKGINFPITDIGISGLTGKDKEDLKFVAQHADVVNFSFVNSKEDVEELLTEFDKLNVKNKLSIILKIETQKAFDNLTEIILAAMRVHYVGVMIARGDLAVETGWNNIGWVQNEILSLCNAGHIPVVWATQVLENLAKKGLPSRSEITDATSSIKADCVMLNKGPYINSAISLLDTILSNMERYQEKNAAMMPKMSKLLS